MHVSDSHRILNEGEEAARKVPRQDLERSGLPSFFSIYYDMVLSMPRVFAMYYTAGFSKTLLIIHIKLHCFLLPRCVRQHCPLS